ncbi:hypothetical protein L9F63_016091 [Diploptera punctata]|uniref:Uncharacterized protein n=1 Tax=Diploptera punctata TaxID=6984 RepID=A0AAD8A1H0_DIPPU|nr:hypothetical protein L9F63_016091 [Diploptera punctata]
MGSFLSQLGMGCKENYKGTFIVTFFLLWIYYCLQIYTLYQSSLFGCLLKPTEYPPIKTLKQLEESDLEKVMCVDFQNPETELNMTRDECEKYKGISVYDTRASNIAFFDMLFKYNLEYNLHKAMGKKFKYVTLEEVVSTKYVGMYVNRLGCMFHNKLDDIQYRLYNSGIVNQWLKEMIEKMWRKSFRELAEHQVEALKLLHLQGVFYLLFTGLLLSFIVFIVESMIGCANKNSKVRNFK